MPPQDRTADLAAGDIDPATVNTEEEEDDAQLPEIARESNEAVAEGPLAVGHAAIENAVRLAPTSPGVYRMLNAANDVLYVGKAKNVRKRLASYARVTAPQPARILRMIAATVSVEIISTATETEALLLEANLIKQLRPRFNVQLRDDKSLGTANSQAPWRANPPRAVFRAVCFSRRGQSHHHGASARLPGAFLH
jgi:excinuclease ABC subunit C